jgi:hypothetical protein
MVDYITFKSFYTKEGAVELSALLLKHDVPNRIQKSRPGFFNQLITGNSIPKEFHIQIREDDLIKANNVLENFRPPNLQDDE